MAYDFDGTTDYFYRSTSLTYDNGLSFSAWVNPDVNNENSGIVSALRPGTNVNFAYMLVRTDGAINATIRGTTVGDTVGAASPASLLQTGSWQHLAAFCGKNNQSVWYNGTKYTTGSAALSSTPLNPTQIEIGAESEFSQDFNGSIEMVGVWDRELTDGEFIALSKGIDPKLIPNGKLYCPLI